MPQTAPSETSSAPSSFAGLLASIAAPKPGGATPLNEDGIADDIVTLSYEQALRAGGRYRSSSINPESAALDPGPSPLQPTAAAGGSTAGAAWSAPASGPAAKPLKTASITIRLSEPECAQLRRRAAETGLTMSAYLRSCTLEVESLRAQVKETLARLRKADSGTDATDKPLPASGWSRPGPLTRLWDRVRHHQIAVRPQSPESADSVSCLFRQS